MIKECQQCGNEFRTFPSAINRGGGKYCSRSCATIIRHKEGNLPKKNLSGEKHPLYIERNCIDCNKRVANCKAKRCGDCWKIFLKNRTGEKHFAWITNRTELVKSEKKHLDCQYRDWMKGVKDRDSWKCKISNSDCDDRLEAHHILNWVDYPELRYKLNNGITLCHAHHPRGRVKEKRLVSEFQELVSVSS